MVRFLLLHGWMAVGTSPAVIRIPPVAAAVRAFLAVPLVWHGYLQRGAASWIHPPGLHALWLLGHDYFGATYASALLLTGCCVLAVLPPGRWRPRGAGTAARAPWWHRGGEPRLQLRRTGFYVATHAHNGDGVLFFNSFYRKAELGYPGQFHKTSDFTLAITPATSASDNGINKPFTSIRPLMPGHRRIWVIGGRPSAHLNGLTGEESLVLPHDFTRVTVRSYKGLWLTLWIRRDGLGVTDGGIQALGPAIG